MERRRAASKALRSYIRGAVEGRGLGFLAMAEGDPRTVPKGALNLGRGWGGGGGGGARADCFHTAVICAGSGGGAIADLGARAL